MAPPKKQFGGSTSHSGTASPAISLAEDYSFADAVKPFKDPNFRKNVGRRSKSIKQTVLAERERGEKVNREMREKRDAEMMEVEGNQVERREVIDVVTCKPSPFTEVGSRKDSNTFDNYQMPLQKHHRQLYLKRNIVMLQV